jgi:hypothetical protein
MADPYEQAFAELQQTYIDLDGDGRPDIVVGADPMREINRRMGPMTPATRAGFRSMDLRASDGPQSPLAQVGSAVLDYGSMPAQMFVQQASDAGRATGEFANTGSLADFGNMAVQNALLVGRPLAAGALGGGTFLEAARRDLMSGGDARAQSFLTPEQRAELKSANDKLAKGKFGSGAERRTLEATVNRLNELDAELAKTQAGNVERQRAADAERRSTEDAAARGRANAAYQAGLDTDRRFSDTAVGQVFDKVGPLAPGVVAAGTGLVSGLGMRGMGVTNQAAKYVVPVGAGVLAGGASAHWPMAYEAMYAPTVDPNYAAALNYIREAPEGDPRAAQLKALIADGTLKEANPVRANAERELYDPVKFSERTGLGVIEGAVGGLAGGEAAPAVGYLVRSAPGAAYELGRTPARAVRGIVDGLMEPSAAHSANRAQGGSTVPPIPPGPNGQPPNVPVQQYRSYQKLPDTMKGKLRDAYIADRAIRGGDLPPDDGATALKNALAASGINVPISGKRIRDTNAMAAAEEAAGRKLTSSSPAWNRQTLVIPLAVGAGASPLLDLYGYGGE